MIVVHLVRNTLDFAFEVVYGRGELGGELLFELVAGPLGLPESAVHRDACQNHDPKHYIDPHDFGANVLLQQLRVVNHDELEAVDATRHFVER